MISNEPLADYIPLYRGSKNEIVTQFDMNSIEKLGYVKFDFLGLKTLTILDKAVKYVRENQGEDEKEFNLDKIPLDDPKVYALLREGATMGIFQVESQGMKDLLAKLQPAEFEDITAALALYRPGPLDSGMAEEFTRRKNGSAVDFPHPALREILGGTYGLFVYQEQIMQTASELAGFTMGEADLLRRAMGKKKSSEMRAQRKRFLTGAEKKGLDSKKAAELFDTLEKFAEYSFNKSHSAAYAMITYQTAYLKSHYPAEFMAAFMSVEANNMDKVIAGITECRKLRIEVLQPDINQSSSGFTVSEGKIRFGFTAIKYVGNSLIEEITKSREKDGAFESIFDFCARVDSKKLNKKALESLIMGGAFDSLEPNRAKLFASRESLSGYNAMKHHAPANGQGMLFDLPSSVAAPTLEDIERWDDRTRLENELEVLGFFISSHPLQKYSCELEKYSPLHDTESVKLAKDGAEVRIAGVVRSIEIKNTRKGTSFIGYLVLEDLLGFTEAIVFNDALQRSRVLLEQKIEPVIVKGKVEVSDDKVRLLASDISSLRETRTNSAVCISIARKSANEQNILSLREILEKFPGDSTVIIDMKTDLSEAVLRVGNCKVNFGDELIENIEGLLGEGAVTLRESSFA